MDNLDATDSIGVGGGKLTIEITDAPVSEEVFVKQIDEQEAIFASFEDKLAALEGLLQEIDEIGGVDKTIAASIENVAPGSVSGVVPMGSFTEEPSDTNKDDTVSVVRQTMDTNFVSSMRQMTEVLSIHRGRIERALDACRSRSSIARCIYKNNERKLKFIERVFGQKGTTDALGGFAAHIAGKQLFNYETNVKPHLTHYLNSMINTGEVFELNFMLNSDLAVHGLYLESLCQATIAMVETLPTMDSSHIKSIDKVVVQYRSPGMMAAMAGTPEFVLSDFVEKVVNSTQQIGEYDPDPITCLLELLKDHPVVQFDNLVKHRLSGVLSSIYRCTECWTDAVEGLKCSGATENSECVKKYFDVVRIMLKEVETISDMVSVYTHQVISLSNFMICFVNNYVAPLKDVVTLRQFLNALPTDIQNELVAIVDDEL